MESQRHHRRIYIGIARFAVGQKLLVDQLQAFRSAKHQVRGDQSIQTSPFLRIVATNHRLELDYVILVTANTEHRVIKPLTIRGFVRIADPIHQLLTIHFVLELLHVLVGGQRKLVVAISREQRVRMLKMLLVKLKPLDRILR